MDNRKYAEHQEQLARFAKAMAHPARIAILQFLASQDSCFWRYTRGTAYCQGYGVAASQGA